MSRLSDFRSPRRRFGSDGLRSLVWHLRVCASVMPRKAAFALIFFSGAAFLFAQEHSSKATGDKAKDMLERAIAQAESAATISHQVKDVFGRVAKAVVKIHGVDE